MQVKIKIIGTLKRIVGVEEVFFEEKNANIVEDFINLLVMNYPVLENELLDPFLKNPLHNSLILVDGVEINSIKGINTPVENGSEIVILPVTHGG
jgi:molybdopterin converting factor small subunit